MTSVLRGALAIALLIGCGSNEEPSRGEGRDREPEKQLSEQDRQKAAAELRAQWQAQSQERRRREEMERREREGVPAPPDVGAVPEDAQRSASGLAWRVLQEGTGDARPGPRDRVTAHYTGWTTDGRMFDSSIPRGEPTSFTVDGVIRGWTEGLQLMKAGEKRRFWIPSDLAYGDNPRGGRPAGMLVFDVELISFDAAPETPSDVAAIPRDAERAESGLAWKVLTRGSGTRRPTATSGVEVHYSGWTTDGNMFDSSFRRGRPAQLTLDRVIPGWTEGVQLMVEGEKRRFWIPAELAYGANPRPGAPQGMLVFDIELVRILD